MTTLPGRENTALLVIDMQYGAVEGGVDLDDVVANIGALTRGYDATLVGDAHTTVDLTAYGAPPPEQWSRPALAEGGQRRGSLVRRVWRCHPLRLATHAVPSPPANRPGMGGPSSRAGHTRASRRSGEGAPDDVPRPAAGAAI